MEAMSWEARKYYDDEVRQNLRDAIPDEALWQQIEAAYNDSVRAVERKEIGLHETYARVAGLLAHASEVSGVSEAQLLTITRRIAVSMRDTEWHQILAIIDSFYRVRDALSQEKQP